MSKHNINTIAFCGMNFGIHWLRLQLDASLLKVIMLTQESDYPSRTNVIAIWWPKFSKFGMLQILK